VKEGLAKFMNSNLLKRIASAVVLLPLLILIIFKAPFFLIKFLVLIVAILSLREWNELFSLPKAYLWYSILLYFGLFWQNFPLNLFLFFIFLIFSFSFQLFRFQAEVFARQFFPFFFGLSYVYFSLSCLTGIISDFSREHLFYLLMIVFANDTGAYFAGKTWGKTPFFASISPRKTWEGFWGGIGLSFLVGYLVNLKFSLFDVRTYFLVTFFVALSGTLGDLLESAVKRSVGKKDSGALIPGHGGILDRIDGLLLAGPIGYLILKILS
jgi:phosphatidate cytidylyltransferase